MFSPAGTPDQQVESPGFGRPWLVSFRLPTTNSVFNYCVHSNFVMYEASQIVTATRARFSSRSRL